MLTIGIDMMGGDGAPTVTSRGVQLALAEMMPETRLALIGPGEKMKKLLSVLGDRAVSLQADEVVEMQEHPVKAMQLKPRNSIAMGYRALASGEIDALAGAGHSGAMMIGAMQILGMAEGFTRPVVVCPVPQPGGSVNLLLDVGINADCKPAQFAEFAHLGTAYAEKVFQMVRPRVALLNTGSEPGKGNILYQRAHQVLAGEPGLNFTGNLEARELFSGKTDVTVCDGFTGNIVLKQIESFYQLLQNRHISDPFLDRLNYERYGGMPVLGVNGNVVLGHGASNATAIKNMILAAESLALAKFANKLTCI